MKTTLLFVVLSLSLLTSHAQWTELGGTNALGANGIILAMAHDNDGNIYVAGSFENTGGKPYVAKWNGSNWSELGTGVNALNPNSYIDALACDNAGNVYAGGLFTNGSSKYYVAKWNGTSWSELGAGGNELNANGSIYAIATDISGNVYATGIFKNGSNQNYVAKWNGSSWSELAISIPNHRAVSGVLINDTQGNLYCAAFDSTFKYHVLKWNGSNWSNLGNLNVDDPIYTIAVDANGNVYAAGEFQQAPDIRYVAKWNGNSWTALGSGNTALNAGFQSSTIFTIGVDGTGNVYAGGLFKNGSLHAYVGKWNGSTWAELGTGSNALKANNEIGEIYVTSNGTVYAAGAFTNGSGKNYVAKWDGVTGIDEQPSTVDVQIYPNPTTNDFSITLPENLAGTKLRMMDMTGRVVLEKIIDGNSLPVNIADNAAGLYFVEIVSGTKVSTHKLIKE